MELNEVIVLILMPIATIVLSYLSYQLTLVRASLVEEIAALRKSLADIAVALGSLSEKVKTAGRDMERQEGVLTDHDIRLRAIETRINSTSILPQ